MIGVSRQINTGFPFYHAQIYAQYQYRDLQMIAGHARSMGLILVTNNMTEFERVPGLRLHNWV